MKTKIDVRGFVNKIKRKKKLRENCCNARLRLESIKINGFLKKLGKDISDIKCVHFLVSSAEYFPPFCMMIFSISFLLSVKIS